MRSTDPAPYDDVDPDSLKQPENPSRPLPRKLTMQERRSTPEHVFVNPSLKPRRGKATLDTLQRVLADHRTDPRKNSALALAKEHQLNPLDVENLVKHYGIFDSYEKKPDGKSASSKHDPLLPQPDWEEAPKDHHIADNKRLIGSGQSEKKQT